jgi:hypothetical protein
VYALVHLNQNGITAEIETGWSAPTNVLADLPDWLTNLEFTADAVGFLPLGVSSANVRLAASGSADGGHPAADIARYRYSVSRKSAARR